MTPALLASVRTGDEALIAVQAGVGIIDLKEPNEGALGAVPLAVAHEVVTLVGGRIPVSSTIGDMALIPDHVLSACRERAATKVDYIKIGLFAGDLNGTLKALAPLVHEGIKLIAVVLADGVWTWRDLLVRIAEAGFAGVMLDTQNKALGSLLRHLSVEECQEFVQKAQSLGMLTGLAGSLTLQDIPPLKTTNPDYLGFRGALCSGGRTGDLSVDKIRTLVAALQ